MHAACEMVDELETSSNQIAGRYGQSENGRTQIQGHLYNKKNFKLGKYREVIRAPLTNLHTSNRCNWNSKHDLAQVNFNKNLSFFSVCLSKYSNSKWNILVPLDLKVNYLTNTNKV